MGIDQNRLFLFIVISLVTGALTGLLLGCVRVSQIL